MNNSEGLKYTPLFHSEISSSHLLHDIFENHKNISIAFLNHFLKLKLKNMDIHVKRERNYPGEGSIDLFFSLENEGQTIHVLLEVKVHDYLSAKKGQIQRYYDAARRELADGDVYFIYLTQFNQNNQPDSAKTTPPPTIGMFNESRDPSNEEMLKHVNWIEFHNFLNQFRQEFSSEEELMLSLQKEWIVARTLKDIEDYTNASGTRPLAYYFDDISIDLKKAFPSGNEVSQANRLNFVIQLSKCTQENLNQVFEVISTFAESGNADRSPMKKTDDLTFSGVKEFFNNIAQDEEEWVLLSFYAALFSFVNKTKHLTLHGTGGSGFSIKLRIKEKGPISLCTLRKNRTLEFGLLR
jgi:hypothetical protein